MRATIGVGHVLCVAAAMGCLAAYGGLTAYGLVKVATSPAPDPESAPFTVVCTTPVGDMLYSGKTFSLSYIDHSILEITDARTGEHLRFYNAVCLTRQRPGDD